MTLPITCCGCSRVGEHEPVTVTDGHGRWRSCYIVSATLRAIGDVATVGRDHVPSTIAVAIPKQDRPEWLVQKATELGIDRIVFLHAERSVVRWDGARAERHLTRLARVAGEAMMQSRQVWLPEIVGPVPAVDVLPRGVAAEPDGRSVTVGRPSDRDRTRGRVDARRAVARPGSSGARRRRPARRDGGTGRVCRDEPPKPLIQPCRSSECVRSVVSYHGTLTRRDHTK